jgi:hypothetical protein
MVTDHPPVLDPLNPAARQSGSITVKSLVLWGVLERHLLRRDQLQHSAQFPGNSKIFLGNRRANPSCLT